MIRRPPRSTLFPTRRSSDLGQPRSFSYTAGATPETLTVTLARSHQVHYTATSGGTITGSVPNDTFVTEATRSEEHTSELQSRSDLVCRLLLEKKNTSNAN